MYTTIVTVAALAAVPLVAAHGKVTVFAGDLGGNSTALGVEGGVVAVFGQNYQTEPDTTTFWSKDINTDDDFGYTDAHGDNTLDDLTKTVTLSGSTLAQVSAGGYVNGTWQTVTSDGAGPLTAIIDTTGTGKFSAAVDTEVTTNIPGDKGEYTGTVPSEAKAFQRLVRSTRRWLQRKGVITRRATDVGVFQTFTVSIPSNTTCTGSQGGYDNLCIVKISNNNENGPFGSVLFVQLSNSTSSNGKRAMKFVS